MSSVRVPYAPELEIDRRFQESHNVQKLNFKHPLTFRSDLVTNGQHLFTYLPLEKIEQQLFDYSLVTLYSHCQPTSSFKNAHRTVLINYKPFSAI